jgi:hypothetical protein
MFRSCVAAAAHSDFLLRATPSALLVALPVVRSGACCRGNSYHGMRQANSRDGSGSKQADSITTTPHPPSKRQRPAIVYGSGPPGT